MQRALDVRIASARDALRRDLALRERPAELEQSRLAAASAADGQRCLDRLLAQRPHVGQAHAVRRRARRRSGWMNTRVMPSASATAQACWPPAPPKQHSVYSVTS